MRGGGQPNSGEDKPPLSIADPIAPGILGTVVDEIWNGTTFNKDALQTLLNYLTPNGKFKEIGVSATTSIKASDLYSSNYNNKGENEFIIVTFGGIQWILTYLSQDINGNIIATLWQATTSTTSKWSNGYTSSAGASDKFPSNMYSTSYMRAVNLNNGGIYATSTTASTTATQSLTHTYAKFTMSEATESVVNYLVQPKYVSWQQHQSAKTELGRDYNCPNDEWESSGTNYASNYDYGASGTACSAYYSAWKEDYIWLPSVTEIGDDYWNGNGIWGTNNLACRMDVTSPWLRSGYYNDSSDSYYYISSYATISSSSVTDSYHVRPALHLNLKAATASVGLSKSQISEAEITDMASQTYTGSVITPKPTLTYNGTTLIQDTDYTLSYSNNINAGTATITITGIGDYEGTKVVEFNILPVSLEMNFIVDVQTYSLEYTGSAQAPTISVLNKTSGGVLASSNYTITYSSSVTGANATTTKPTEIGKHYIIATGTGNCTGTLVAPFEIVKAKITTPTFDVNWFEYTGSLITFSPTYDTSKVTISGNTGTNAGEYTATFTLKDTTHYEWQDGTTTAKTLNWLIAKKTIPKPTVKSSVKFTYTGYEQEILPEHLNNWIDGVMVITGGNKFTNVGKYTLQVALTTEGAKNYVWKE